jgi:hypothetical protein
MCLLVWASLLGGENQALLTSRERGLGARFVILQLSVNLLLSTVRRVP